MHRPFLILGYLFEFIITFVFTFALVFIWHISNTGEIERDKLKKIKEEGLLKVAMHKSLHSYYVDNTEEAGFEYELIKNFAEYMDLKLEVKASREDKEIIRLLDSEEVDLAIPGLPLKAKKNQKKTSDYMHMHYLIVSHRNSRLKDIDSLSGKDIHISSDSKALSFLYELIDEGIAFNIVEEDTGNEELFLKVSTKEAELAIMPNYMAQRYQRYYPQAKPDINIGTRVSFNWLIPENSHQLEYKINSFLDISHKNGSIRALYEKYYGNLDIFDYVDLMRFHKSLETRLPRYEKFIKKYAEQYGFDWRLIAAQAYQESHLNPWAQSHAGAKGLMQLVSRTARSLGVNNIYDPEQNIEGGVKHLKNLHKLFDQAKEIDRTYIALAAYNVGQGHMLDARNLARKLELNPDKWHNIEKTLLMLEEKKYYEESIYGYCRGSETVNYIKKIILYYDILRHKELLNKEKNK